MTPNLTPLIERLEAASGGDRTLDGLIEVAARWVEAGAAGLAPEHRAKWRSNAAGMVGDAHTDYHAPAFTTSCDAALTLIARVLPGWFVGSQQNRYSDGTQSWSAWLEENKALEVEATHDCYPIALCIAALRALATDGEAG